MLIAILIVQTLCFLLIIAGLILAFHRATKQSQFVLEQISTTSGAIADQVSSTSEAIAKQFEFQANAIVNVMQPLFVSAENLIHSVQNGKPVNVVMIPGQQGEVRVRATIDPENYGQLIVKEAMVKTDLNQMANAGQVIPASSPQTPEQYNPHAAAPSPVAGPPTMPVVPGAQPFQAFQAVDDKMLASLGYNVEEIPEELKSKINKIVAESLHTG